VPRILAAGVSEDGRHSLASCTCTRLVSASRLAPRARAPGRARRSRLLLAPSCSRPLLATPARYSCSLLLLATPSCAPLAPPARDLPLAPPCSRPLLAPRSRLLLATPSCACRNRSPNRPVAPAFSADAFEPAGSRDRSPSFNVSTMFTGQAPIERERTAVAQRTRQVVATHLTVSLVDVASERPKHDRRARSADK